MSDQVTPSNQETVSNQESTGNRQPASHALRDAAERLRSRASDLEAIADALERCTPEAGFNESDGPPFIGVGSSAEIALWRIANFV